MKTRYAFLLVATCFGAATNAQLVGFYNVGGDFASYDNLTEAFDDLMAQGANGDVTFIFENGTYTGQASLGTIPGNPGMITVRSGTNNAADVILEFDAAFPLPNHIIELDGSANVKFEDVTFHALNEDRARIIHFTGNTDNLKLWDCVFIGSQSANTSSYFDRALVYCDQNVINVPENPDYLSIIGCEFRYGYEAIELNACPAGGARALGVFIAENTFIDQLGTGVYIQNAVGEFSSNRVTTKVGNGYVGLRTAYFDSGSKILRNVFQLKGTIYGTEGIEVGNTQSTTENMIADNMITVEGPGENWGLAIYNLWGMSVVYNTVAVLNGDATSKACYHLSNFPDGQDVVIRDNIFANYSGGVALESTVAANIVTEDHNDLYSSGANVAKTGGTNYATLAAYQSGTGDGASDVSIDPAFPFLPDLHLNSCALDNVGDYFYVPAGDIDYQARGNPICDIGADEYTFSSGTVNAPAITVAVDELPYLLTAPNGSNYLWSNASSAQTIAITTGGPYTCHFTDVNGCTYTVSYSVSVDFSTGVQQNEVGSLRLFPNPATDAIMIAGVEGRAIYTVFNAEGRRVLNGTVPTNAPIAVDHLAPGIYTLRIEGTLLCSARFVKR